MREEEAQALNDFLLPMLEWHHDGRASAEKMLKHPWLDMPANYVTKYSEHEYQKIQLKKETPKWSLVRKWVSSLKVTKSSITLMMRATMKSLASSELCKARYRTRSTRRPTSMA